MNIIMGGGSGQWVFIMITIFTKISRGTELSLVVSPSTTVRDVKQDLATRTGLPFENIQFNQGQAELPDSFIINPQNTLPYFLFNKLVQILKQYAIVLYIYRSYLYDFIM